MSPGKHWKFGSGRRVLISRCERCRRLIWPWQHQDWTIGEGMTTRFHTLCVKP